MTEKIVEEYKAFDFEKDTEYKKFLTELNPPPPPYAIEFIKRQWYKQYINKDFNPNFDGSIPDYINQNKADSTDSCCDHTHKEKSEQQPKKPSRMKMFAYHIENLFKVSFMTSVLMLKGLANYLSLFICIMAILRQLSWPKFNKVYLMRLVQNDFCQNLMYMLPFAFYKESRNIIYFFPLMVHYWIGICEYIKILGGRVYNQSAVLVEKTRASKQNLMNLKSNTEIALLPLLFVLIFFGYSNIFLVLFYYNFIKIKYMMNNNTQKSFERINNAIKDKLNQPKVPRMFAKLYEKVEQFIGWTVKYGNQKQETQQNNEKKDK